MSDDSSAKHGQVERAHGQQAGGDRRSDPAAAAGVGSPAQDDLMRMSELLRRTERLARTGSWEWCPANGELVWSDTLFRIYGYEPGEVTPTLDAVIELAHPDDRERVLESTKVLPRTGQLPPLDFRIVRKDGSIRHLLSIVATESDGDLPAIYFGTIQDRTDWIEADRRLHSAYEHLEAITDAIADGVVTVNREGRLGYMNPAALELFGWTYDELEGKVMHDVVHFRRPDGSPYPIEECPLRHARQDGENVHVDDDVFIRRDGSELRVEYTSAPFETEEGTAGSVIIFRDIAARKAHEEELEQRIESLSWIGRIRDALHKESFVVHAQPIFDLRTDEIAFRELLIRMQGDDGAIIPPGQFLPIAEEFSIIADIDCWMIGQAAKLAAGGFPVTVNISAQTIARRDIGPVFEEAIVNAGADPGLIIVELTETALIDNEYGAARSMEALQDLGCQLALDDFGSGYGGFTYLKHFRFDYLKIDAEFVRDLSTNLASEHVVKAMVNLAEGFSQQVVAEGVEDAPTLEALRRLGVDCAQGFHLARPGPLDLDSVSAPSTQV